VRRHASTVYAVGLSVCLSVCLFVRVSVTKAGVLSIEMAKRMIKQATLSDISFLAPKILYWRNSTGSPQLEPQIQKRYAEIGDFRPLSRYFADKATEMRS